MQPTVDACPSCAGSLVRPAHDAPVWCRECEWNLDAFAPPTRWKATRLDRLSHRVAFRLNTQLLAELTAGPPPRPALTPARVLLGCVSLLLAATTLTGLVSGLLLIFGDHIYWARIIGVFVVLLSLEVRPRWPRSHDGAGAVTPSDAPNLYKLVNLVADHVGAPHIHTIVLDDDWNAACGREGIRRRPILYLGLPLWSALGPHGRLALLGHELGHLINGDPDRGLLTQPALTTFGRLAAVFDPRRRVPRGGQRILLYSWAGAMASGILFSPLWFVCRWTHLALRAVAGRDHQRAEIFADAVGLGLGGSAGAAELLDTLLFDDQVGTAVSRSAHRGEPPAEWGRAAAEARTVATRSRGVNVQHSLRIEASLFRSHPPTGMRQRLVATWPTEPRADLVSAALWDAADADLARPYERTRRALNNAVL